VKEPLRSVSVDAVPSFESEVPLLAVDIPEKYAGQGRQRRKILDSIRFTVSCGAFISVVGPSGCGKTTLLRCIAGLDPDYTGRLTLDGRTIRGPSLDRGVVFQEHRLFPWMDVRSNIAFAARRRQPEVDRRVDALLDLVGLTGFERLWPKQLSGGMAQRVALARALLNVPQLLLLDEPLGALDNFTRERMQAELQRIVRLEHVTALLVTHDIDEAITLGDQVLVMASDPGRIACTIDVHLDRPKDRNSPAFVALRARIEGLLSVTDPKAA
jgi:sulfonate transport system ATP-binding protein